MIGFDKGKINRVGGVALLESGKHLPGYGLSLANSFCAIGFGRGSRLIASAHASNIALQPTAQPAGEGWLGSLRGLRPLRRRLSLGVSCREH
jgi:hypothetical protein